MEIAENFVGKAVVEQLAFQRAHMEEMRRLHAALGAVCDNTCDLPWTDWLTIMAAARKFRPDAIIELGRGVGTSTALFRYLDLPVVSVCNSDYWETRTVARLSAVHPIDWSRSVHAIVGDINSQDYSDLAGDANRILLFWDAHGYAIAETVFSRLLPALKGREIFIICHDMRDARYFEDNDYRGNRLWTSQRDTGYPMVHLGNVFSSFEQVVSIVDFCSRNQIELHSATHSVASVPIARSAFDDPKWPYCLWYYFSVDGRSYSYPSSA
jgi:hypothetical protein